jgi:hypothetical protein
MSDYGSCRHRLPYTAGMSASQSLDLHSLTISIELNEKLLPQNMCPAVPSYHFCNRYVANSLNHLTVISELLLLFQGFALFLITNYD